MAPVCVQGRRCGRHNRAVAEELLATGALARGRGLRAGTPKLERTARCDPVQIHTEGGRGRVWGEEYTGQGQAVCDRPGEQQRHGIEREGH
ncbi:hypothetical protein OPT61_g10740 [Boeremia exigua]|uniref:Uncharacterized protein n=1 Tax=Boeremia exigua TaxID=749465 RepID=A0ACC2HN73_9PLEO|nr:hypothetical protein OPT61_g10740 [Boeremia exigua]